jgi:hypothetical protein
LKELGETHDAKQQGYGKGDDHFANYRAGGKVVGLEADAYVVARIAEKMQRVEGWYARGEPSVNIQEELLDIAVMAVIAKVLQKEEPSGPQPGELIHIRAEESLPRQLMPLRPRNLPKNLAKESSREEC